MGDIPAEPASSQMVTNKPIPKDADVLVTIDDAMDLTGLARAGRRLKGFAQTINLAPTSSSLMGLGVTSGAFATIGSAIPE